SRQIANEGRVDPRRIVLTSDERELAFEGGEDVATLRLRRAPVNGEPQSITRERPEHQLGPHRLGGEMNARVFPTEVQRVMSARTAQIEEREEELAAERAFQAAGVS